GAGRVGGGVWRLAAGAGGAGWGQGARRDRAQDEAGRWTSGGAERTCVACQAPGARAAGAPLLEGPRPRVAGLGCVGEWRAGAGGRGHGWSAAVVGDLSPLKAPTGNPGVLGERRDGAPPQGGESGGRAMRVGTLWAAMRGSRWRGSACVCVRERTRPRGGEGLCASLRGFGLAIGTLRVQGPALTES